MSFGISMVIIASRVQSLLFMIGAALSVLAGCCKVAWKLVLGIPLCKIRNATASDESRELSAKKENP